MYCVELWQRTPVSRAIVIFSAGRCTTGWMGILQQGISGLCNVASVPGATSWWTMFNLSHETIWDLQMTYMIFSDLDPKDSTGVVPIFRTIQSPSKELWDTETSVSVSVFPVLLQRPLDKLGGGTCFNGNSNVSRVVHENLFWNFVIILLNSCKNVCQGWVLPSFLSKKIFRKRTTHCAHCLWREGSRVQAHTSCVACCLLWGGNQSTHLLTHRATHPLREVVSMLGTLKMLKDRCACILSLVYGENWGAMSANAG